MKIVNLESLDPFFAGYEHLTHDERLDRIREYIRPFEERAEDFAMEQAVRVVAAAAKATDLPEEEKNLIAQAVVKLKLGLPMSALEDMGIEAGCDIDRECIKVFDEYLHTIIISKEEFLAMKYVPQGTTVNMETGIITVPWYSHPEPLEDK